MQLSASAKARPGGVRSNVLVEDTATVDVTLTKNPAMAVSVALADGQTGIFSAPGMLAVSLAPGS